MQTPDRPARTRIPIMSSGRRPTGRRSSTFAAAALASHADAGLVWIDGKPTFGLDGFDNGSLALDKCTRLSTLPMLVSWY